jgi:hypothetical protein
MGHYVSAHWLFGIQRKGITVNLRNNLIGYNYSDAKLGSLQINVSASKESALNYTCKISPRLLVSEENEENEPYAFVVQRALRGQSNLFCTGPWRCQLLIVRT